MVKRPVERNLTEFGAVCDGLTNDREAVQQAVAETAAAGEMLIIDKPVFILIRDEFITDPVRLFSNTTVHFRAGGKLIVEHDKLPVFWSSDASDITFDHALITYHGTHDLSFNQQCAAAFNDRILKEQNHLMRWPGPPAFQSVFHLRGGTSFNFTAPRFVADTDEPAKMFALCFYFGSSSPDQTISKVTISDAVFDGCYMPILTQNFDGFYLLRTKSIRYGVLPSSNEGEAGGDGGWFPPPHIFYNSAPSTDLVIDGLEDEGVYVGGGNWGQTSLKPTRIDRFMIRNVHSVRDYGLIDFNGSNGHLDQLTWRGDATRAKAGRNGVYPVRWLNAEGKIQNNVHWADVDLYDTSTTYRGPLFSITNSKADRPVYCTMRNININQEAWKDCGIVQDWMEHCEFEVNWTIRDPRTTEGEILLWGAKNSLAPNKFTGTLKGFNGTKLRVIATKGSVADFSDLTGKRAVQVED